MKKAFLLLLCTFSYVLSFSQIDMQAHAGSDEGLEAYTTYFDRQEAYYTGYFLYDELVALDGNDLFGALNALMGQTSKIGGSDYSYNSLRDAYVKVDVDLNNIGKMIIGYYDGRSMNGKWDGGKTWNREHTWPQSKGADKGTPMGHDMQSVRPTWTKSNSERGNTAYGEGTKYYDPDEVTIENEYYKKSNLGSYRGDAARVIVYDYVVYGEAGGHKNHLYKGNAQLLSKVGSSGVFESIEILLKWHMADPPSLTEVVRNDGAASYQGNRNPFIDFPELAIQMLKNSVTTYSVTSTMPETLWPNYHLTLKHGFLAYVTAADGSHPDKVAVTNATSTYDPANGRLTITNVTGNVSISTGGTTGVENFMDVTVPEVKKVFYNGNLYIIRDGIWFDVTGRRID
ncbi:MAG: endonuclease [Paludibacteraceae bacterium]|nr:endonuclease [Paludibacteraceae bacterium]